MTLARVDYLIFALYFGFVLGIGWLLKKRVATSEDFLTSGRSVPVWITSLAFIAANMGAQEMIGMCASGAKYGIMTAHFYWVGAIPAMIFVGVFMMPFYYGSRARSVPEYLKLRFDEKTRTFNAVTFAAMTVFSSGISMYALGLLFELVLGWSFASSVLLSAAIVLVYTYLGGLTSAIYNEVLQFFLIVLGFSPLAILAVAKAGGISGPVASSWASTLPGLENWQGRKALPRSGAISSALPMVPRTPPCARETRMMLAPRLRMRSTRSRFMQSGVKMVTGCPSARLMAADEMRVLPLVASMMVSPGRICPSW